MFKLPYPAMAAAALLLAAQSAWSGTPINEKRPLNANAKVSVNNIAGSIIVQAWDRNELSLTGELGEGSEKLEITGDAASLNIVVKLPKHSHNAEDSLLQLRVPTGASLDLQAVSADIRVQGVRGAISVNTVSGDVNLDVASAQINAQTVSGDVHLRAAATKTRINSVSGDVTIGGASGDLKGESVSGNVDVEGGPFSELKLHAVSGDVHISGGLTDKGSMAVESLSGDIVLRLPGTPSAALVMKTFSGDLSSDFGSSSGSDHNIETRLGDGKGSISLSSFSGDIDVRRDRH